jgi:hypothetical protein
MFVLKSLQGIDDAELLIQTMQAETMDFVHFFDEACLYCHNPEASGKNFRNISFERHCAECHIKADAAIIGLPRFDPANPLQPGVRTIRQMQKRSRPGMSWIYASNPNLTIDEEAEVSKNMIVHKDPWILENLKDIRRQLLPGNGLHELLDTVGPASAQHSDSLYGDVILALRRQVAELNNRGELRSEVDKLKARLKIVADRLENPYQAKSVSAFELPSGQTNSMLSDERRAELLQLANDLTNIDGPECRRCHIMKNASILPVQSNQDVLLRAEFNHRAHILERRCIDCHTYIDIEAEKLKLSVTQYSEFKDRFTAAFESDQAGTQNIPGLANCLQCHTANKAASSCITCHNFHPNKQKRSNLQLKASK